MEVREVKDHRTKHVLIGEDDDDDFYIFSSAISELPYTIILTRAENGEILIRLLDEKNPDILFLDILMPTKDGRQCLREIRRNSKYDLLPIIIYSSISDFREIEFCYREGANLYAIKPESFSDLKAILDSIFSIDWKKKLLYFPPLSEFIVNPKPSAE